MRLTCASHDDPPKVGESTNADTTLRPVARIAASSAALGVWRREAISGRSKAIAPYDSMKIRNTSAPRTCDRSASIAGLDASIVDACIAPATSFAWRAYVAVTGVANTGVAGNVWLA